MKSSFAVLLLVFFLATMYLSADGTSPMKCGGNCNTDNCFKQGECKCGSIKDECNCCTRCLKCAGEECLIIRRDLCAGDLKCKHPANANQLQIMNTPGTCS